MLALIELLFLFVIGALAFYTVAVNLYRWNQLSQLIKKSFHQNAAQPTPLWMLFSRRPQYRFRYARTECRLKTTFRGWLRIKRKDVEIQLQWPDRWAKLDIISKDQQRRPWGAGKPVVCGSEKFQNHFDVYSRNPDYTQLIESEGVELKLFLLAMIPQPGNLSVRVSGGKLTIVKTDVGKNMQAVEDLIRGAVQLFDQVMLNQREGIDFVDDATAIVMEDVKCPICTTQIEEDLVVCPRCQTPHCRDCWEYNGKCATFACQAEQYARTPVSQNGGMNTNN